jgi:hypothetical protein
MAVTTEHAPAAVDNFLAGRQLQQQPSAQRVDGRPAFGPGQLEGQQQEQPAHSLSSSALGDVDPGDVQMQLEVDSAPQQQQQQGMVCRDSYSWLVSWACDIQPPSEAAAGSSSGSMLPAVEPVMNYATVAICTSLGSSRSSAGDASSGSNSVSNKSGILPASGAFCGVALPGKLGGAMGQQQFLIDVQGSGAGGQHQLLPSRQQPATPAGSAAAAATAAAPAAGSGGGVGGEAVRRVSTSDSMQLDVRVRAAMSVLVTAWHEMLLILRGPGQQSYCLMPDLVAALEAGDAAAVYAFKQVRLLCCTAAVCFVRLGMFWQRRLIDQDAAVMKTNKCLEPNLE